MIQLKADNFADIVKGKAPKIMVPQDEWDNVLKIIKEMPTLERFEEGERAERTEDDLTTNSEPQIGERLKDDDNAFEKFSNKVKVKLNGGK